MVTLDVCAFQIIQHTSSLRDHLKQAAPRMVIFFVDLKVLGKFVDSLAQQGYLHLRGTSVSPVGTKLADYLLFRVFC